jgi:tetratricopeptide (TPR) repeat protein
MNPTRALLLAFATTSLVASGSASAIAKTASHASYLPTVMPFIEDDYDRALARAKAENKPLFIETWAPWCHTCRSMKAFVFTDKKLAGQADKFVWLAIDSENSKNARALKLYPVSALPTFFVVSPGDEKVARRWVGGMNVTQVASFLDEGASVARGAGDAGGSLAAADRLYGDGKYAEAAPLYQEAIAAAPASWPEYSRAAEALLYSLSSTDKYEEGARFAEQALPKLTGTPSELTAAATGLDCALSLPAEHPQRRAWAQEFERQVSRLVEDPRIQVAVDDRSGAYGSLVEAFKDRGDTVAAQLAAERWAGLLERASLAASTPQQRTVFDSHRLGAYRELHQPERAIPMLQQSEKDFPDDYNPPYRLSIAYTDLKRWDEAVAASDRALARAYGPRKVLILRMRSDLMTAKGDAAGAREAIVEAIRTTEALPPEQKSDKGLASLRKKLDALSSPAGTASK